MSKQYNFFNWFTCNDWNIHTLYTIKKCRWLNKCRNKSQSIFPSSSYPCCTSCFILLTTPNHPKCEKSLFSCLLIKVYNIVRKYKNTTKRLLYLPVRTPRFNKCNVWLYRKVKAIKAEANLPQYYAQSKVCNTLQMIYIRDATVIEKKPNKNKQISKSSIKANSKGVTNIFKLHWM